MRTYATKARATKPHPYQAHEQSNAAVTAGLAATGKIRHWPWSPLTTNTERAFLGWSTTKMSTLHSDLVDLFIGESMGIDTRSAELVLFPHRGWERWNRWGGSAGSSTTCRTSTGHLRSERPRPSHRDDSAHAAATRRTERAPHRTAVCCLSEYLFSCCTSGAGGLLSAQLFPRVHRSRGRVVLGHLAWALAWRCGFSRDTTRCPERKRHNHC